MTCARPEDLMTTGDIAKLVGVKPQAVSNWIKRDPNFPDPWARFGATVLYLKTDVQEYLRHKFSGLHDFIEQPTPTERITA